MSDTFEKVKSFIERRRLLDGAERVLVAVSGGPDSIALLDILVRLLPAARLHVAHLVICFAGVSPQQTPNSFALWPGVLG